MRDPASAASRGKVDLGAWPTQVVRLEAAGLWVKRDDIASDVYGGNKVRKLELLLGAARAAGRSRLLTLGAVGSHQVVATTVLGVREGFTVDAVLVSQPASLHAETNVRVALALGLRAHACPAWSLVPAYLAPHLGRDAYFIPLGGSNVVGSLAFAQAAHEVAAQVKAGELAEPDLVVVAMGSGGTAAGLAVGFEQAGMKTRVLGVAVAPPTPVLRHLSRRLAQKTAAAAGLGVAAGLRAAKRVEVDGGWIGRGYGHATDEGRRATEVASRFGITLDPTYTAKAFACALTRRERDVLFWHTLSTASHEPLLGDHGGRTLPLPAAIASLLR